MFVAGHGCLQFTQQLFLFVGEIYRSLIRNTAKQITRGASAYWRYAFATQAEQLAGLRAFRHFQLDAAIKGGHLQFAAETGINNTDRHFAIEVAPFALKEFVILYRYLHVEIAAWPAVRSRFSFARQPDTVASIHAGGDFDVEGFGFFD